VKTVICLFFGNTFRYFYYDPGSTPTQDPTAYEIQQQSFARFVEPSLPEIPTYTNILKDFIRVQQILFAVSVRVLLTVLSSGMNT